MVDPVTIAKAATVLLTNEKTRKGIGWALVAILSPVILVVAFLFTLAAGGASNNIEVVQLCFNGGDIPDNYPAEYREYIQETRDCFSNIDSAIEELGGEETGLDAVRVKAVFFSLYFGADDPAAVDLNTFLDCFVDYETRTRTVTTTAEDGSEAQVEENYEAAIAIEDLNAVYENIKATLGVEATEEQRSNADSIYDLVKNGYVGNDGAVFDGADVPYIGVDGFCSPVGANWRSIVTSEFGNRIDPITGQRDGHTGMDLAVPTGTPIRAALDGVVTLAKYYGSYGNCVMIDHGNGLVTLYGHNSRLLVHVGQTVRAGDVISQSGATGRVTGPHLHFEVRINGERTNPRYYLP